MSGRTVVVDRNYRIHVFFAKSAYYVVGTFLHFCVGTLHSVQLDTAAVTAGVNRRYGTATQSDTVMLYPTDNMMTLLPKEGGAALTEQTFNLPKSIAAPVRQGDVVGTVTLTIEGEVIGTTDLIAGSDVARNQVLYTIARVGEFFSSTYFKVVVMLTMIVVAVYAFLFVLAALGVLKPIEKSSKKRTNK